MPDKLLELKNDLVFQKVFGMQKNSHITGHLLSLILEKEIHDVDLDVNKRILKNRSNSKTNVLDIRVKFNNGEDCNIEMQVVPYQFMPERMLDYWAGMYDNKINRGEGYEVLKPSISILIADYNLEQLKDVKKYHTIWNLREKEFSEKIITNNIELHILEIPKIKDNEILKDELAQWLKFIENPGNEEVEKFMEENRFLKQAKEELAYLSDDPDFQLIVDSRVRMLRDIYSFRKQCEREADEKAKKKVRKEVEQAKKKMREEAEQAKKKMREEAEQVKARVKAEVKAEGKKEIAKKMKELEIPIDKIEKATGLTKKEIEEI